MPLTFHIMHQNLRVFGGGSLTRNQAFADAMEDISTDIGSSSRVLVCGFTEVMNAGVKSQDALSEMAKSLDPCLVTSYFIACGVTACKDINQPEYVCISVFKESKGVEFKPGAMGKVLRLTDGTWKCYPHSDACPIHKMPKGDFGADIRGLAYIYGTVSGGGYNNKSMLVGFMHNMYGLGDRSGYFSNIGIMVKSINDTHKLQNPFTLIGGDFNLPPRDAPSRTGVSLSAVYEKTGDQPTNTTSKHPYDYWLTNNNNLLTNPRVLVNTRDVKSKLSDHAAISVQVKIDSM